VDIVAGPAQRTVLELQIDGIVFAYLTADVLNVAVAEFPDPTVGAAEQILIQIEHPNIENIAELAFQATGVGSDTAQLITRRN